VDHESPLLEAIIPYRDNEFYQQMLHALAREFHIDLKKPFKDLPEDVKEGILRKGFGRVKLPIYLENGREIHVQFRPVLPEIERRIKKRQAKMFLTGITGMWKRYLAMHVVVLGLGPSFVGGNRWAEHLSSEQYGFQTLFRLA